MGLIPEWPDLWLCRKLAVFLYIVYVNSKSSGVTFLSAFPFHMAQLSVCILYLKQLNFWQTVLSGKTKPKGKLKFFAELIPHPTPTPQNKHTKKQKLICHYRENVTELTLIRTVYWVTVYCWYRPVWRWSWDRDWRGSVVLFCSRS